MRDWLFSSVGGGNTYEIINVNSNMCLTSDGVAGDQVYQEPCDGSLLQQWNTSLTPGNGVAYTIKNVSSGLYLDVSGDSLVLDPHLVSQAMVRAREMS